MRQVIDPISAHLSQTYGGKRGLARSVRHFVESCLGGLAPYRRVDWRRVSRVVFVCKGNICRSPFAAVRFQGAAPAVLSAGLEADHHQPADPRAVAVAARLGTDLSAHRSIHVQHIDLGEGDLLVAFEPEHAHRLLALAQTHPGVQATLLGLWSAPAHVYFHDPYGLPEAYFERCFRRIDRSLAGLRDRLASARLPLETGT